MTENATYKYEYLLHVWGGFFNPWNIEVHGELVSEYLWFDTIEERETEKNRLLQKVKEHGVWLTQHGRINDSLLVVRESEGYLTRFKQVISSLVKVDGEIITVENLLGYGFFSDEDLDKFGDCAQYMKEWKWSIMADLPEDHERLYTTLILRK